MLLNTLQVTNSRGQVLNLPLDDVSSGFIVTNIDGLDPVEATLVSSSFANLDGEEYKSSKRTTRNIKITLGLDPDFSTSDVKALRDQLYSFFMPKTVANMVFTMFDKYSDSVVTQYKSFNIAGRIETFVSPMWAKDPTVDISLICYDPDFLDPAPTIFSGVTTDGLSLVPPYTLTYDGSVDSGVLFTLSPEHSLTAFSIYQTLPDGSLAQADFTSILAAGDVLTMSSVPGAKYVRVAVSGGLGGIASALYSMSPQSAWLTLQPGDNILVVKASGDPIPFTIEYTNRYGGL